MIIRENQNNVHVVHHHVVVPLSLPMIFILIFAGIFVVLFAVLIAIIPSVILFEDSQMNNFINERIVSNLPLICLFTILITAMSFLMWDFLTSVIVDLSIALFDMIYLFSFGFVIDSVHLILGFFIISAILYGFVNIDFYKMHIPSRKSVWFFFENMFRVVALYYLLFVLILFISLGVLTKYCDYNWVESGESSKVLISVISALISGVIAFLSLKYGKSIYFILINKLTRKKIRKSIFNTLGFKTYYIITTILSFVSYFLVSMFFIRFYLIVLKHGSPTPLLDALDNYYSMNMWNLNATIILLLPVILLVVSRIIKTVKYKKLPDISSYSPYFIYREVKKQVKKERQEFFSDYYGESR